MTLDQIMRTLAEIEDADEFQRLWKMLGEILYEVTKRQVAEAKAKAAALGEPNA